MNNDTNNPQNSTTEGLGLPPIPSAPPPVSTPVAATPEPLTEVSAAETPPIGIKAGMPAAEVGGLPPIEIKTETVAPPESKPKKKANKRLVIGGIVAAVLVATVSVLAYQFQKFTGEQRGKAYVVEVCVTDSDCGAGYTCRSNVCVKKTTPTATPTFKKTPTPTPTATPAPTPYCSRANYDECQSRCVPSSAGGSCPARPTPTPTPTGIGGGLPACSTIGSDCQLYAGTGRTLCVGSNGINQYCKAVATPTPATIVCSQVVSYAGCKSRDVGSSCTDELGKAGSCKITTGSTCYCSVSTISPTPTPTPTPTATKTPTATPTPTGIGGTRGDTCGTGLTCVSFGNKACLSAGGEIDLCYNSSGAQGTCCKPTTPTVASGSCGSLGGACCAQNSTSAQTCTSKGNTVRLGTTYDCPGGCFKAGDNCVNTSGSCQNKSSGDVVAGICTCTINSQGLCACVPLPGATMTPAPTPLSGLGCAGVLQSCNDLACCTGQNLVCQGTTGNKVCQQTGVGGSGDTWCSDTANGGGSGGKCSKWYGFKCNSLTNNQCLQDPSLFDTYSDAKQYAGSCGQIDQVCDNNSSSRTGLLCGGFEIVNTNCGGPAPTTPPTTGTPTAPPTAAACVNTRIFINDSTTAATTAQMNAIKINDKIRMVVAGNAASLVGARFDVKINGALAGSFPVTSNLTPIRADGVREFYYDYKISQAGSYTVEGYVNTVPPTVTATPQP